MSFRILIHDDISIAQLIEIDKSGGRVLKTPHIGNIYPNNLALISLGIPTLLYDRTIGIKDKSFHPHKIIYNGIAEQIADPATLSTHSRVQCQPKNFIFKENLVGRKIVDPHLIVCLKIGICWHLRHSPETLYLCLICLVYRKRDPYASGS